MSHFTILVPADNRDHLERVLLPYHEYECTGIEEYIVWMDDIHDEYLEDFQSNTIKAVVKDGTIIGSKYSRTPEIEAMWKRSGFGHSSNDEFILAPSYELVEMPCYEYFEDFDAYVEDWCGGAEKHPDTGRYGRWTNPNAKWDWWLIGGRWTGTLQLKSFKALEYAGDGRPGLMTPENEDLMRADFARAGDIDWDGIAQAQLDRTMDGYRRYQNALERARRNIIPSELASQDWFFTRQDETRKTYNADGIRSENAREAFKTEEDYVLSHIVSMILVHEDYYTFDTFQEASNKFYKTESEYRDLFKLKAVTYAFIDLEGQWNQRAEMGWWGCSDPEQGTPDYDAVWWKFVRALPNEQMVYIVDCHI